MICLSGHIRLGKKNRKKFILRVMVLVGESSQSMHTIVHRFQKAEFSWKLKQTT